jgi:hypothetical protein
MHGGIRHFICWIMLFSSAFSSLRSFSFNNAKLMRGAYISRLKHIELSLGRRRRPLAGRARAPSLPISPWPRDALEKRGGAPGRRLPHSRRSSSSPRRDCLVSGHHLSSSPYGQWSMQQLLRDAAGGTPPLPCLHPLSLFLNHANRRSAGDGLTGYRDHKTLKKGRAAWAPESISKSLPKFTWQILCFANF